MEIYGLSQIDTLLLGKYKILDIEILRINNKLSLGVRLLLTN